jgi:hypothetical protein
MEPDEPEQEEQETDEPEHGQRNESPSREKQIQANLIIGKA